MVSLEYLAGVIDRGCHIGIQMHSNKKVFLPVISITKNSGTIAQKFNEHFDGYIHKNSLSFRGMKAIQVARVMKDYVFDKRRHMEILIALGDSMAMNQPGHRLTTDENRYRKGLMEELRRLNVESRKPIEEQKPVKRTKEVYDADAPSALDVMAPLPKDSLSGADEIHVKPVTEESYDGGDVPNLFDALN